MHWLKIISLELEKIDSSATVCGDLMDDRYFEIVVSF